MRFLIGETSCRYTAQIQESGPPCEFHQCHPRAVMANVCCRIEPTQARPYLIPIAPTIRMGVLDGKNGRTTMIYTHVFSRGGRGVSSPADVLAHERPSTIRQDGEPVPSVRQSRHR